MAPARVIADSDESDDDINLGDSPSKPPIPKVPSEGRSSDPASVATGSTDPNLFQAIYIEQQRAAASEALTNPGRSFVPNDVNSLSLRSTAQARKDTTDTSSLTSITDPVMDSNHSKKAKKAEVVDLTQVTTPGRSANTTQNDMWDVPSSPAADQTAHVATLAKTRTPRSNMKRKRGNNVEFTSPLAVEMLSQCSTQPFDATPAGRSNAVPVYPKTRSRLENPESSIPAEDDVDMVVVPSSAAVPSFRELVSGQKPVSLCIEPHTLSASQRLEYEYHSIDPSPEDQGPVPTQPFSTLQAAARSSGATTIAYSTPSQTRVVGFPPASFADVTTPGSVREQTRVIIGATTDPEETAEIQSSPDIISAAPARLKRDRSSGEWAKTAETQRDNVGWDSDDVGFHPGTCRSRLSRHKGSDACRQNQNGDLEKTDIPVADMGPAAQLPVDDPAPARPLKPKTRGRPRKLEAAAIDSITAEALASRQVTEARDTTKDPAGADTSAATQQAKKKRGRPRKADKTATVSVQQEHKIQLAAAAATARDAKQNEAAADEKHTREVQLGEAVKPSKSKEADETKHGSTANVVEASIDGPQERGEALVLQAVTSNAASKPGSDGPGPQSAVIGRKVAADDTPANKDENKAELVGKTDRKKSLVTPASSAGKPIYRVGLSKKSRIAPLLKSLRK